MSSKGPPRGRSAAVVPLTVLLTALFCLLGFYLFLSHYNDRILAHVPMSLEVRPSRAVMPPRTGMQAEELPWWHGKCSRFKCSTEVRCNSKISTYLGDSSEPPCCAHLLRDMLVIFDEVIQKHNLAYYVGFGTLLGLYRDDHIITWTGDNDLVVTKEVAEYIEDDHYEIQKDLRDRGLSYVNDNGGRLCFNSNYQGNVLERRFFDPYYIGYYPSRYPYTDLLVSETITKGNKELSQVLQCTHSVEQIEPMERAKVYDGAFEVYYPAKPEEWLVKVYGHEWNVPDQHRTRNANTTCAKKKLVEMAKNVAKPIKNPNKNQDQGDLGHGHSH